RRRLHSSLGYVTPAAYEACLASPRRAPAKQQAVDRDVLAAGLRVLYTYLPDFRPPGGQTLPAARLRLRDAAVGQRRVVRLCPAASAALSLTALGHLAEQFTGSGLRFDAEHGSLPGGLVGSPHEVRSPPRTPASLAARSAPAGHRSRQVDHRQHVGQR